MRHRVVFGALSLLAAALVVACVMRGEDAWARAALPAAVLALLAFLVYAAAGGPGVLRVGGAMFRKTLLTYLSYRAQLVAIVGWTTLTVLVLFFAGGHVLRALIPALATLEADEAFPRHFVVALVIGFTTWPIFWKAWEVTTLGVRTEQWEGTFEPMVPMPYGVRSLPFGYLFARIPYTIFFNLVVLGALALAMPEGAIRLRGARGWLDFAAVLGAAIACMWGLGLLFGGLAVLYKRVGPIDLVVRTLFIFLAGVFIPVEIFPGWAQGLARLLPMTYAYELLRMVAVDGIPLAEAGASLGILLGFAAASILAGNALYHHFTNKARRLGAIQGY